MQSYETLYSLKNLHPHFKRRCRGCWRVWSQSSLPRAAIRVTLKELQYLTQESVNWCSRTGGSQGTVSPRDFSNSQSPEISFDNSRKYHQKLMRPREWNVLLEEKALPSFQIYPSTEKQTADMNVHLNKRFPQERQFLKPGG